MADVFGAVVGAIALLQLSVKGARILQNVSEIESDFKDLCDEVRGPATGILGQIDCCMTDDIS